VSPLLLLFTHLRLWVLVCSPPPWLCSRGVGIRERCARHDSVLFLAWSSSHINRLHRDPVTFDSVCFGSTVIIRSSRRNLIPLRLPHEGESLRFGYYLLRSASSVYFQLDAFVPMAGPRNRGNRTHPQGWRWRLGSTTPVRRSCRALSAPWRCGLVAAGLRRPADAVRPAHAMQR
jgi:hypothetical protein